VAVTHDIGTPGLSTNVNVVIFAEPLEVSATIETPISAGAGVIIAGDVAASATIPTPTVTVGDDDATATPSVLVATAVIDDPYVNRKHLPGWVSSPGGPPDVRPPGGGKPPKVGGGGPGSGSRVDGGTGPPRVTD
jgi:hypothetical protein